MVRKLFILTGVVILIMLPVLQSALSIPLLATILAVIIIAFFAGLTNPLQKSVAFFNMLISATGLVLFEYQAVLSYVPETITPLFGTNQILALIFFFALYYSVKTLRGMMLE
jgi:hypothetical protein